VINNGTMPISYTSKEKCKISVFIIVLGESGVVTAKPFVWVLIYRRINKTINVSFYIVTSFSE
jgi:hypothetical protein